MSAPPTAAIADACIRLGFPVRHAPHALRPIVRGKPPVAGRANPVQHTGSVDVFLEAYERGDPGDMLVIDNQGRMDQACIGDLTVIEALDAKMAGIVLWGLHRDDTEIRQLGLPVHSLGRFAMGPPSAGTRPADALDHAQLGDQRATRDDMVVADDDGVLLVNQDIWTQVESAAKDIAATERAQADQVRAGTNLRTQFEFKRYLQNRANDPNHTFRDHLRTVGKEIEV